MLILVQKENEQDQAHLSEDTYFNNSQLHQLAIMYYFEHAKHIILLYFYSKIFRNSFCFGLNCISNIFHI